MRVLWIFFYCVLIFSGIFFTPITMARETPSPSQASQPVVQALSDTSSLAITTTDIKPQAPPLPFGYDMFRTLPGAGDIFRPIPNNYPIGPGDEIDVHIWGPLEFTETLKVDNEGYVAFTKLNHRVNLNGVSFSQLQPLLLRELSKFYAGVLSSQNLEDKKVQLEVRLSKIRGINLYVLGEVKTPGAQYLPSASADLLLVLTRAGGIQESGSLRNIQINHTDGQSEKVDLYDLLLNGKQHARNLFMREGDMVFVPIKQKTARIDGQVRRPNLYELTDRETLKNLLTLAGGPTPKADLARIQITRQQPNHQRELLDIDITTTDAPLFDGDQISVTSVSTDWRENIVEIAGGGIRKPGKYRYDQGMTLTSLISLSGGLYEDALLSRADLVRTRKDQSKELIQFNLTNALNSGYALQPLDRVITYSQHTLEGGDKNVTITGQVKNPGSYTLAEGMTLYDLLFIAGGVEDPDYRKTIYLDRADIVRIDTTASQKKVIPVDLRTMLSRPKSESPLLNSQDQIVVYAAIDFQDVRYVRIDGAVRKPNTYLLYENMTLKDLIVRAGGLKETAEKDFIEINRTNNRTSAGENANTLIKVPATQIDTFSLQLGDVVLVRENPDWRTKSIVAIFGEIRYPGQYVLDKETEYLSDLVTRAGGLLETAFPEGCRFYRLRHGQFLRIGVELPKALDGNKTFDPVLIGSDSIYIPTPDKSVEVHGEINAPNQLIHWRKGAKASYYIQSAGNYTFLADKSKVMIQKPNGIYIVGFHKFWFDPDVPPGSTILVPAKPPKSESKGTARPPKVGQGPGPE